ncbi:MAG: acyl carrier protein [Myxococcota bacterium]
MPNRETIYAQIVEILSDTFELDPADISEDANLYEELGLDSIDAVDIFVQLREITGRRPDPDKAREIRTVGELCGYVIEELDAAAKGLPEPDVKAPPTSITES